MARRELVSGVIGMLILGIGFPAATWLFDLTYLNLRPLQSFFNVISFQAPNLTTYESIIGYHELTIIRKLPHSLSGFYIINLLKIEDENVTKVHTQTGYCYFEASLLQTRFRFKLNGGLAPGAYKYSVHVDLHFPRNVSRDIGFESNIFYVTEIEYGLYRYGE